MQTRHSFGIDFLIRKCKEDNKRALIYVRITVDKERKEISIKENIDVKDWDSKKEIVKGKSINVKGINGHIEETRFRIRSKYRNLEETNALITAETVKQAYLGIQSSQKEHKVIELLDYYNKIWVEKLKKGGFKNYRTTIEYIKLFISRQFPNGDAYLSQLNGFVYQQTDTITNPGGGIDTLQFIAHEEGRARWAYHKYTNGTTAYKYEYDFYEKDHLGNTRMVLTQERDTSNYLASMEAAYRATESQLFANIASTSYAWSSVPGSSGIPSGTKLAKTNPNDSVSKVDYNGTTGQKTGPSLLLKVMSGDTVTVGVQSYYNTNSITTTNTSLSNVLASLVPALLSTPGGGAEGSTS